MQPDLPTVALRTLTGALGGAAGGAGAGAAIGAYRAGEDERREGARQGALRGAAGGALAGASHTLLPLTLAQVADALKARTLSGMRSGGMDADGAARAAALAQALEKLREHATGSIPGSAMRAAGAGALEGASSAAMDAAFDYGRSFLRRKMGYDLPGAGTQGLAQAAVPMYEETSTEEKAGSLDPTAPTKAEMPEDSPLEQKHRRLAELLKKVVPTSSAGGSASPTPPRGTP